MPQTVQIMILLYYTKLLHLLKNILLCQQGVKIKMDDAGNILIRRYSKSNVFVKSTAATSNEETAIGQDIVKLPGYSLEQEKIFKVRAIFISEDDVKKLTHGDGLAR